MKHKWNIIGPKLYIDQISKSKYFQKKLGRSLTLEKNNERFLRMDEDDNTREIFTTWYYNNFKALIFKAGEIGPLYFYIDHFLKKEVMGFFMENESDKHQYLVEWSQEEVNSNGIDIWLSEKLKEIDETLDYHKNENEKEINTIKEGNANKLLSNPGGVTWEDIKKYKQNKNI